MYESKDQRLKQRLLLYNGFVHTQSAGQIVDSVAIENNRIVAIGHGLQFMPELQQFPKYNLKGKMVTPGFTDAHAHLFFYAVSLGRVSLHKCATITECLRTIKSFVVKNPGTRWIVGEGFPLGTLAAERPDRYMLDKVTQNRPAFLFGKDHHTFWVNSPMLEVAGITVNTPDPKDSVIERFDDGTPTGILKESIGYMTVFAHIPQPRQTEMNRLYAQALKHLYRVGITAVHSFDSPQSLPFYVARAANNTVGVRINHYPRAEVLDKLERECITYGQGTPFFRFAGIKLFADGTLGSQTALCFQPYRGSHRNFGIPTISTEEMKNTVNRAASLGFPCAIHAIGDKAVSNVLDVYATAPRLSASARHRIEHLQLIRRSDIKRFRKFNVTASMQPSHLVSDIPQIRRYWAGREDRAYVFRSLLNSNVRLAFGSDAPIEPFDPLGGISACVNRNSVGKRALNPSEKLTAAQALAGFTSCAAYAAGQEHEFGFVLPGYPADLTILSEDFTKVSPRAITSVAVVGTIVDGHPVYLDSSLRL